MVQMEEDGQGQSDGRSSKEAGRNVVGLGKHRKLTTAQVCGVRGDTKSERKNFFFFFF